MENIWSSLHVIIVGDSVALQHEQRVVKDSFLEVIFSQSGIVGFHVSFGYPLVVRPYLLHNRFTRMYLFVAECLDPMISDLQPSMLKIDSAAMLRLYETVLSPIAKPGFLV